MHTVHKTLTALKNMSRIAAKLLLHMRRIKAASQPRYSRVTAALQPRQDRVAAPRTLLCNAARTDICRVNCLQPPVANWGDEDVTQGCSNFEFTYITTIICY
jgi:hypothetical protein